MDEDRLRLLKEYGFEKTTYDNSFIKLIHITDALSIKMKVGSRLSSGRTGFWCDLWLVDSSSSNIWIGNPDGTSIVAEGDNSLDELLRKANKQVKSFAGSLSRRNSPTSSMDLNSKQLLLVLI